MTNIQLFIHQHLGHTMTLEVEHLSGKRIITTNDELWQKSLATGPVDKIDKVCCCGRSS